MASNFRAEFRERKHKRLSKSIVINHNSSKKAFSELASAPSLMPVPLAIPTTVTLEPDEKLPSVDDIAYHEMRRPFIVPENLSEESFECMTSSPPYPKSAYVPSQDEIFEFLKRIISFTEREPLIQNMGVFFSTTQRILVEIDDNPNRSFTAQLLYDTPDRLSVAFSICKTTRLLKQQKW
ncbi:hypothetical protein PVL29_004670 [Vitis rotundifolia]|uniref:Uncharacterized protein n=1 Tax=Vitis rotundifolia TaxID=103349 RepID=A0AA39A8L3_VITRO|nr:hypothetical protein PVL29_004670 [Vitis rotundifolia]